MVQMLNSASKLDWSGWLRGLIGAAISGGAGAVSSGFSVQMLDKAHDINVFEVMAITFLFSAAISLAKYLQTSPVPDVEKPQ